MNIVERIVNRHWSDAKTPYKFYNTGNGKWVIYLGGLCGEYKSLLKGTIHLVHRQIKLFRVRNDYPQSDD